MKIPAQEAVKIAVEYVRMNLLNTDRLELEEIESSEDDKEWLITIGFDTPNEIGSGLGASLAFIQNPYNRNYKVIKIDKESKEVISMKIRKI